MDHADLWPRYYFDLDRAKLEIADWLKKRHQVVTEDWREEISERDWRHELFESLG